MAHIAFKGIKTTMKKFYFFSVIALLFSNMTSAHADLNILSCEPEWASLANELGGSHVTVHSATTAYQDPHHIEARPSLIAKVRRADLLICSGAELESGWLPMLQRQANNASVLTGKPGYFEAATQVLRLDIPKHIDRSMGDVHASGNPHVHLDPRRIKIIAKALSARLAKLDTENTVYYQQRYNDFVTRWGKSINQWEKLAEPLKGKRIVIHHRDWVYLFDWLGIEIAGTLEPKPGLPATAGHLSKLKNTLRDNPAFLIIHTPYQSNRAARRLSKLINTNSMELPHTTGATEQTETLFDLFETLINKLTGAIK